MNYRCLLILGMILAVLITPVLAESETRYSYINIDKMTIELVNEKMYIHVDYTLDTPIKVLIFLMGKNDLKGKLVKLVNYENAILKTVEFDRADLIVEDEVIDYGDGAFWLPEHEFYAVTPILTIETPQATLKYFDTNKIPNGVGYFRVVS
jgi:hypothetical protein